MREGWDSGNLWCYKHLHRTLLKTPREVSARTILPRALLFVRRVLCLPGGEALRSNAGQGRRRPCPTLCSTTSKRISYRLSRERRTRQRRRSWCASSSSTPHTHASWAHLTEAEIGILNRRHTGRHTATVKARKARIQRWHLQGNAMRQGSQMN